MRLWALLILFVTVEAGVASTPADAVSAALTDSQAMPVVAAQRTRYLSLYATAEKDRPAFLKALAFHVNSLSREAEPAIPRVVGPDLVAVTLDDYGWDPKVWEQLAEFDPYFHLAVIVEEDVFEEQKFGNYYVGNTVCNKETPGATFRVTETRKIKVSTKKARKAAASAPWLDAKTIGTLIVLTGSQVPVVRADWFLVQTAIARKDQVSYYQFLGLGTKEADFQKLIGADPEVSRRVRREIAAVMGRSGVALNNRRLVRLQSVTGGYWASEDFKTSKGQQNTLKFLLNDTDPPRGDASEQYGVLPNGMFAYWLQNADGVRQDVVPPDIAQDNHTRSNDKNIYGGIRNCATCHIEGIRPVDDYARRIYRGANKLQSADYTKFLRLRQLYLSDLEGQIKRDNEDYARALHRVNGLTPGANAQTYEKAWDRYVETDLTVADAARELGVTPERLIAAAKAYAVTEQARVGAFDPVVSQLFGEPPIALRREHFEEVFGLLQTIIR